MKQKRKILKLNKVVVETIKRPEEFVGGTGNASSTCYTQLCITYTNCTIGGSRLCSSNA